MKAAADIATRQFKFAMVDCQFEGEVCDLFKPSSIPQIFVLGMDSVYQVRSLKPDLRTEDILALISGDEYKNNADIWAPDTKQWLIGATGHSIVSGGFSQYAIGKYNEFENFVRKEAKDKFKKMGFAHWTETSK